MRKHLYYLIILVFLISGCARVRHAVPENLLNDVRVFGMQDVRAFSGSPNDSFKKDFIKVLEQEEKEEHSLFNSGTNRNYCMLALSGGAANGAYGAGLLNGWSRSGTRPVFKVVTGISTGAIIAPLAFLGSGHDDTLKELYTKYSTKDILRIHPSRNAFASTKPLEYLIERYFDTELLKEITIEYNKGRRLYVGTTNLDAQQLVIWDMGKIASIGGDNALKLFRKVILASASIPIALPPVYLEAEANDEKYDEMHVDGGVIKQVFFLYDVIQGIEKAAEEKGVDIYKIQYKIYVIRNGYTDAVWEEIPDKIPAIAERTIETMLNTQSVGDIIYLYAFTRARNGDFNLASIPVTHVSKAKELFDPVEMQALFDLGFEEASQGYPWRKLPPGME